MLNVIITLFMLAVVATLFGFGLLAGPFAFIAKVLSVVFLFLFAVAIVHGVIGGGPPAP